ncbi:MAG: DUF1232 domain-containing protein [Chloroflexota bacterium]|nr:DUF1232 domain-containing protein [Chloroflexota bacterium]
MTGYTPRPMLSRALFGLRAVSLVALAPLAARAPTYGRLLLELLADPRIPLSRKAVLGVAAGYVVMPLDLVPDVIPVVGRLDDIAIVVLALDLFLESVPQDLLYEKLTALDIDGRQLERDLARVRRFVPRPVRMIARRLPDLIEKAAASARRTLADTRPSPAMEEVPA